MFLISFFSIVFFLAIKRVKFKEWLFFNSCSPSNFLYILGFILLLFYKFSWLIYFGIFPMFFFGTLGLFLFPWKGAKNLFVQISHILMTSNIIWIIVYLFRNNLFEFSTIGLLTGGFVFLIFLYFQQDYVQKHLDDFNRVLELD